MEIQRNQWIIFVGIVVLVLIAWGLIKSDRSDEPQETATTTEEQDEAVTQPVVQKPSSLPPNPGIIQKPVELPPVDTILIIVYSDAGFYPDYTSVRKGQTVRFTNLSSGDMWVASDRHETHAIYSGTNISDHCPDDGVSFDQCERVGEGVSWDFTFEKLGEWRYHNHAKFQDYGKILVVE